VTRENGIKRLLARRHKNRKKKREEPATSRRHIDARRRFDLVIGQWSLAGVRTAAAMV